MKMKLSDLPKDVLIKIALSLDLPEVLSLCQSSKRKKLYHITNLNGLYKILESGYMLSRKESGTRKVFSPKEENSKTGNYIYLSLGSMLPSAGTEPVQIVLSGKLLEDRDDYYLNYEWSYGKTEKSLGPEKLYEFLNNADYQSSEIIFENAIPVFPYLEKINIVEKIPINSDLPSLDYDKIPDKFKPYINIIYV